MKGAALVHEMRVDGGDAGSGSTKARSFWPSRKKLQGDAGYEKITVTSGIGIRDYCRKFG